MPSNLALIATILLACEGCSKECSFVSRNVSPDGRYEVVVCRHPHDDIGMPGGGEDAPGQVRLINRSTGEIVRHVDVAMVQLVGYIKWEERGVLIQALAYWELTTR